MDNKLALVVPCPAALNQLDEFYSILAARYMEENGFRTWADPMAKRAPVKAAELLKKAEKYAEVTAGIWGCLRTGIAIDETDFPLLVSLVISTGSVL
jgi:hypothetical protein